MTELRSYHKFVFLSIIHCIWYVRHICLTSWHLCIRTLFSENVLRVLWIEKKIMILACRIIIFAYSFTLMQVIRTFTTTVAMQSMHLLYSI